MTSKTAPYRLPSRTPSERAVLLLHGFSGSPWELRPLAESLADRGFHVDAPLLPGHGATPEALLYVTWRDWLHAAQAKFDELAANFPHVSVGGLSMGGLLATVLAAREPTRLRRLVLFAPVVALKDRGGRLLGRVRHTPLVNLAPRWVTKKSCDIEDEAVRAQAPLLPRYPVERVLDLFALQDLARACASNVRCPSLVFASRHDHVVRFEGIEAFARSLPGARLVPLQRGWHIIPRDLDRARAITETAEFLDG